MRMVSRAATSNLAIMEALERYLEEAEFCLDAYFSLLVAICRRVLEKLTSGLSGFRPDASILLMERPFCL
jgi:hypothetical protein